MRSFEVLLNIACLPELLQFHVLFLEHIVVPFDEVAESTVGDCEGQSEDGESQRNPCVIRKDEYLGDSAGYDHVDCNTSDCIDPNLREEAFDVLPISFAEGFRDKFGVGEEKLRKIAWCDLSQTFHHSCVDLKRIGNLGLLLFLF